MPNTAAGDPAGEESNFLNILNQAQFRVYGGDAHDLEPEKVRAYCGLHGQALGVKFVGRSPALQQEIRKNRQIVRNVRRGLLLLLALSAGLAAVPTVLPLLNETAVRAWAVIIAMGALIVLLPLGRGPRLRPSYLSYEVVFPEELGERDRWQFLQDLRDAAQGPTTPIMLDALRLLTRHGDEGPGPEVRERALGIIRDLHRRQVATEAPDQLEDLQKVFELEEQVKFLP